MTSASNDGSYSCSARIRGRQPARESPILSPRASRASGRSGCACRATRIGPYLSPMLAPCGSSAYLILQVRVGVERDGRDFVLAFERGAVQRLDVGQHLIDLDAVDVHGAARQAIEHERVVGIRTVSDGDFHDDTVYRAGARVPSTSAYSTSRRDLVPSCSRPPRSARKNRPTASGPLKSAVDQVRVRPVADADGDVVVGERR